ncbi:MAG: hypothetical protein O7B25_11080 [Gammaproteobacteria bacterium]|nr:hypothetical protein [Gammaproteobacteria bacterium]
MLTLPVAAPAVADVYSYVNEDGDYVVSKRRPEHAAEYAVLTDEGEFVTLVRPLELDVPVSHWRPWYLPEPPNPFRGPAPVEGPTPTVIIEEVDKTPSNGNQNE